MTLGQRIYQLRTKMHLSQGDLADKLEVSRQSVSKWETDASVPELDKLVRLSQLFGVTLDSLVIGAEPTPQPEPTAQPAPEPESASARQSGRKIAGWALIALGVVIVVLFLALTGSLAGTIFSLPLFLCGLICLTVRRHPGLWCAWAAYLAVYIFCYYGTRISWNLFFFTFSWEEVGTPVYTFAAWIQSLMILALLIGTVRSFCTFSFPPTRRNGVILVVLWIEFLAYRLLTAPIADLLSAPEIPVTSMWALMALILMAGIASLILLAIVLTLSVRMAAAWRASHC